MSCCWLCFRWCVTWRVCEICPERGARPLSLSREDVNADGVTVSKHPVVGAIRHDDLTAVAKYGAFQYVALSFTRPGVSPLLTSSQDRQYGAFARTPASSRSHLTFPCSSSSLGSAGCSFFPWTSTRDIPTSPRTPCCPSRYPHTLVEASTPCSEHIDMRWHQSQTSQARSGSCIV